MTWLPPLSISFSSGFLKYGFSALPLINRRGNPSFPISNNVVICIRLAECAVQSRLDRNQGGHLKGHAAHPRTHQVLLRLCLQKRKPEVVTTGNVSGYDVPEEIRTLVGVFDEHWRRRDSASASVGAISPAIIGGNASVCTPCIRGPVHGSPVIKIAPRP